MSGRHQFAFKLPLWLVMPASEIDVEPGLSLGTLNTPGRGRSWMKINDPAGGMILAAFTTSQAANVFLQKQVDDATAYVNCELTAHELIDTITTPEFESLDVRSVVVDAWISVPIGDFKEWLQEQIDEDIGHGFPRPSTN